MAVGDIHWIEYPSIGGREQSGRRPAILIQDEQYGRRSPLILTVPLTTTASTLHRFPAVVPILPMAMNGLTRDSFALVFQLRAVDRGMLRERIGVLEPAIMVRIFEALDRLLGRSGDQNLRGT